MGEASNDTCYVDSLSKTPDPSSAAFPLFGLFRHRLRFKSKDMLFNRIDEIQNISPYFLPLFMVLILTMHWKKSIVPNYCYKVLTYLCYMPIKS